MTDEDEWSDDDSDRRLDTKQVPPRADAATKAAKAAAMATGAQVAATRKAKRER